MNLESQSDRELARPVSNPAAVLAAPPMDVTREAPAFRSGLATRASATTLSPTSILRALHRRQMLALGVAILAAAISGPAAWFLVPVKFKAQARLQIVAQPPKVLFQTLDSQNLSGEEYKRYQNTQMTLVTSQFVLKNALQDKDVSSYRMIRESDDPIAWLKENLKVEFIGVSEVMEISLSGDNPQELAGTVNAVKKAYMTEVADVDTKRRSDRHSQLNKIKEDYGERLKERREHLRRLAETVGSDDRQTLALRNQYAFEHLAYVNKDLLEVQSQKRKALARRNSTRSEEALEETSAPTVTEADIDKWIDQDPSIADLTAKLAHDQQRLDAESARIKTVTRKPLSDPVLRRLKTDLVATEKLLLSKRAKLRPIAIRQLREQDKNNQVTKGDGIEQELAMLENLEKSLKDEIKSLSDTNHSLNTSTLDLQSLQDEIAQMQASAGKVGSEVEALNIELGAPPRIRTIEDAVVPRTKDDKKRWMIIGLAIIGSFLGGLFGIAFLELQHQKVDSADQVVIDLGLQIVGTLPILRTKGVRGGGIARGLSERERYGQNLMLESIDAARTMLVHAARSASHQVVMITSAVGGEGKTSLASHLATSLARSGLRTLLIDADLRIPSIHRLFDLPVAVGLTEVLRGEVEWADAIAATAIEDLKVLTAGKSDRQTISLLAQGHLGPLFAELKEQFDFVIVDSSPVLPVADGLIVAQHVDAALFSIFRDVSSKTNVLAASDRLQRLGVRILGAVVTGAHGDVYGNTYGPETQYGFLSDSANNLSSDRKA